MDTEHDTCNNIEDESRSPDHSTDSADVPDDSTGQKGKEKKTNHLRGMFRNFKRKFKIGEMEEEEEFRVSVTTQYLGNEKDVKGIPTESLDAEQIACIESITKEFSADNCFSIDSKKENEASSIDEKTLKLDYDFRGVVSSIIGNVTTLEGQCGDRKRPYVIIGGSTVEGAAISRFFQPTVDGGNISKNAEVEVDLNLVVATISANMKHIVEEIPGKQLNVRIKSNQEIMSILPLEYAIYFKANEYVNSYRVKEAAARAIIFAEEEPWLKGIVALAKNNHTENIEFFKHGEFTKPTAATDVMIKIDGNDYVNFSLDLSIMLKIEWTPPLLNEWVNRERAWPSKSQINELSQYCYLISKPSNEEKESRETSEFSYSFHHIETRMAQLRSIKQNLIYMKFKSIIYCYLKTLDPEFASFNGKNIMLMVQEIFPPDHEFWQDENCALRYLIGRLMHAIENEQLPYYFIQEHNVMKSFDPTTKKQVLQRLQDIKNDMDKYLRKLPVNGCHAFYGGILEDCTNIRNILELKRSKKYSTFSRLEEDQFMPLAIKSGANVIHNSSSISSSVGNLISFVGRSDEMEQIHQIMCGESDKRAIVLYGMGGIGKSELTRQYTYRYSRRYSQIIWVHAESKFLMQKKFVEIANKVIKKHGDWNKLPIEKLLCRVFKALANEEAIFIFDNIENPKEFSSLLVKVKDENKQIPCILVTSQSSDFDKNVFHIQEVKCLPTENAIEFLRKQIPDEQFDNAAAKMNAQIIGCHPLGLQVSAAYIIRNKISIKEFNDMINRNDDVLLYKLFPPDYGKPLYSALNISVQSILLSDDKPTIDLLCTIAFLDGQELETGLLLTFGEHVRESLNVLQKCSLLRKKDEDRFEMHSLVQTLLKNQIDGSNTRAKYLNMMLRMIGSFQQNYGNIKRDSYGNVWLHHALRLMDKHQYDDEVIGLLERVKGDIHSAFWNKGEYKTNMHYLNMFLEYETKTNQSFDIVRNTRVRLTICMECIGMYDSSIKEFGDIHEKCKSEYGEEHPTTLTMLSYLAFSMSKSGNYAEARELYEQLYNIRKTKLGNEHKDTLHTMWKLAQCMINQREMNQARVLLDKAYEVQQRTLGEEHPNTLPIMDALARCMEQKGEREQARNLREQLCIISKRVNGETHPDTLVYMMNLGVCMSTQGEFENARKTYNDILDIQKRKLGNDDPLTLLTMYSLANSLNDLNRLSEAYKMVLYTYEKRKTIIGEHHVHTQQSKELMDIILNKASTCDLQGPAALKDIYKTCKSEYGEEYPTSIRVMSKLAGMISRSGNYSEARELYKQLYNIRKTKLGDEHKHTLHTMWKLAQCMINQREMNQARVLLDKAYEVQQRTLGEEHPNTLPIMDALARCMEQKGERDQARNLREQLCIISKRVNGETHSDTLVYMINLGVCMRTQGEFENARKTYNDILDIQKRKLGNDDPLTLLTMYNLADCLYELNSLPKAYEMALYAYEKRKTVIGEHHVHTQASKSMIDTILKKMNNQ